MRNLRSTCQVNKSSEPRRNAQRQINFETVRDIALTPPGVVESTAVRSPRH